MNSYVAYGPVCGMDVCHLPISTTNVGIVHTCRIIIEQTYCGKFVVDDVHKPWVPLPEEPQVSAAVQIVLGRIEACGSQHKPYLGWSDHTDSNVGHSLVPRPLGLVGSGTEIMWDNIKQERIMR